MTQPTNGTTVFDALDGSTTVVPTGNASLTVNNYLGWNFTFNLNSNSDGQNELLIVEKDGSSSTETVDALSNGVKQINYLSVQPNDGSLFTLDAITVVINGYNSTFNGGSMELVGYLNGVAVAGATLTQTVSDIDNSGSPVTFNVSSNGNFVGITSFRVIAANGNNVTGLIGIGAIDATTFHLPGPTLTLDGGSAAFVAGNNTASTPIAVSPGLNLSDTAASTQTSATVAITGNFHSGEDALAFSNTNSTTFGNISASYNSGTGVLTLTSSGSTATNAQWRAALEAVTYTDTAVTPNNANRTISFAITDAASNTSATATRTISVTDTDQTPILTTTSSAPSYVSNGATITIDSGITVSDLDNTTQAAGTVAITGNFNAGDALAFTNTSASTFGNITASYNSGTGTLILTSSGATATDAQWQAAFDAVKFSSSSTTAATRTISFTVNDGTVNSAARTDSVVLHHGPLVTLDTGSASFTAGNNVASTPVVVSPGLSLSDDVSSTLASASVAITGNFHAGQDELGFTNNGSTEGNVAGSYNAGTGVLTLTSSGATATAAQWQAALAAVTYTDTAVTPNNTTRTISYQVNDGTNTSPVATRTVTVTDTDQSPIVTTTATSPSYVTNAAAITIDAGVTVSDLDNPTQLSGSVSITSGFHSGDALGFTNTSAVTFGNIIGSYNSGTGILTLTSSGATATDAQWASAFAAVTFSSTSTTSGARTVSFVVNDGSANSAAATDTVTVADGPTLTSSGGVAAFVAGDNVASTPIAVDPGLTVTDPSSATLASATVQITGNLHSSEDVLGFTGSVATGNITANYIAGTGLLQLTSAGATATLAQWQAALDSITYTDTAITPNTATRTISFAANDGTAASNTSTRTVTVADTEQTPTVTTSAGTFVYLSNAAATAIDAGITVGDRDNATLPSGAVTVSAGLQPGDTLAFTNSNAAAFGNITASYNAATGILSLTSAGATATLAQWRAALAAVTFSSTNATTGLRTISFQVSDGTETSTAATDTINVLGSTTNSGGSTTTTSITQSNFTISNSLTLPAGPLVIANATATPASLTIQGGTLTSGANISNGISGVTIGSTSGTSGAVAVTGNTSSLNSNGSRETVGASGNGSLTVSGGGTVRASASGYTDNEAALSIAAGLGSTATVSVTGSSSQLLVTGSTIIGGTNTGTGAVAGGTGSLSIGNGSTFQSTSIIVGQGSSLSVASGATLATSSLTIAGGSVSLANLAASTAVTFLAPLQVPTAAVASTATHSGMLQLNGVTGAATASGFTFGDSIDLLGISDPTGIATQFAAGIGTLSLQTASGVNAYASSDGNGGTLITPTSTTIGVYRFFDKTDGSYFYTSSSSEAQSLEQTNSNFILEGTSSLAAITPGNGDPNAVPIYRFFDTIDGSHFFTASTTERDQVIADRSDLVYEPSATFYEHLTEQTGDTAVYRFFNVQNGTHFFTDSTSEKAAVLATHPELRYEGIAFYEAPQTG